MMRTGIVFFVAGILVCACVATAGADESQIVNQGNSLYHSGKYDEALEKYNAAIVDAPESDIIHFNLGTAFYQKEAYDKAIDSFTKSMMTDDPSLEAQANYNIGNAKYRQGRLKENTDLQGAVNNFRDALSYYKRAIELDEKDAEAKFNHEFVEKKLKHLLDQLEKQPPEQQQQQEQQQKQQDQESGSEQKEQQGEGQQGQAQQAPQDQSGEGEDEQQAQAAPSPHDGEEEQEDTGEQQSKNGEDTDQDTEGQGQQPHAQGGEPESDPQEGEQDGQAGEERMSEEEARMILENLEHAEETQGVLNQNPRKGNRYDVLRDW